MSTVSRDIRLSVIAEVKEFAREMATIPGTTEKQAAAAARKMVGQLARAEREAAANAAKAASRASRSWRDHFSDVAKIAGGILTADFARRVGQNILSIQDRLVEYRLAVDEAAIQTGLATQTMAGLGAAAEASDSDLSTMTATLRRLPRAMADIDRGTGRAAQRAREMGLSVRDMSGEMLSADDFLRQFFDSLQAIEDPAQRAAAAQDLLGTRAGALLAVLDNREALDAWVDQTERFGVDVGPKAIEAAQRWRGAQSELAMVLEGSKAALVDHLGLAEGLERATLGLVHVINLAKEATEEQDEATHDIIGTFGRWFPPTFALMRGMDWLADSLANASDEAKEATREFHDARQAKRDAAAATEELAEEVEELGRAYSVARDRAAEHAKIIETMEDLRRAQVQVADDLLTAEERLMNSYMDKIVARKEQAEAAAALAETEEEAARIREQAELTVQSIRERADREQAAILEARRLAEAQAVAERVEAERRAANEINQIQQRAHDANKARIAEERQLREEMLHFVGGLTGETFGAIGQTIANHAEVVAANIEDEQTRRRVAAMVAFRTHQATSAAQAVITGALSALTWSQPPPAGIGFPQGTVAAGVQTAASLAAILSQPPPKFHRGRTPDEIDARILRSEGIVSAGAMADGRNRAALQAMNEGQAPSAPQATEIYLDSRHIGRAVNRAARRDSRARRGLATVAAGAGRGLGRGGYR